MLQYFRVGATVESAQNRLAIGFGPAFLQPGNITGTVETKTSKEETKKTVDS
jgi:hypothetical protein